MGSVDLPPPQQRQRDLPPCTFHKLGFVRLFGTRPDEGIGPYKMHTVGPRALTGPPLPRFNYPDKPQFILRYTKI